MKERPILFSAAMVRALLNSTKTQTRRVFSPYMLKLMDAAAELGEVSHFLNAPKLEPNDLSYIEGFCPYGGVGDRLWVKETFSAHGSFGTAGRIVYRADIPDGREPNRMHWKPSIFMPRAASRISLEIVRVQVERLNTISEADALAEGCAIDKGHVYAVAGAEYFGHRTAVGCYMTLWGQINGPGSWAINPWVWVVEFKKVSCP